MAKTILRAIKTFPAIVLTGPRRSGKTTLLKMLFPRTHTFVNLEDPDVRIRAKEDPVGFLNQYKLPVVIDEIQYVPELLSYIKTRIDEDRRPGQWLLTGSQNFLLMHNITQSPAGRAAILNLLPFSFSELIDMAENATPPNKWIEALNNILEMIKVLCRGLTNQNSTVYFCGAYIRRLHLIRMLTDRYGAVHILRPI